MSAHRIRKNFPNGAVVFTALMFFLLFLTVPRALDDYWYLSDVHRFGTDSSGNFNFLKGLLGTYSEHFATDNSRLSNVFGAVLVFVPLPVLALVSALLVGLTLYFMSILAQPSRRGFIGVTAIIMLYTFALPWDDYIFTGIFTFNYVWGAAWMIIYIFLFISEKQINVWLAVFLGIFLGAWHEIFSFSAFVGSIACLIFHKKMVCRWRIGMLVGIAVGCLWLWLSPSRTAPSGYGSLISLNRDFISLLDAHILAYIFIFAELLCLLLSRYRIFALSPTALFAVSTILVCLPVHLLSATPRVIFPEVIMSSVGLVFLGNAVFHSVTKPVSTATKWICRGLWIFFTAHIVSAFATGLKIKAEEKDILTQYLKVKESDGVVFADVTSPETSLPLSFGKPFQGLYEYYAHSVLLSRYFNGKLLRVIPTALKDYRLDEGEAISANLPVYSFDGYLVAPYSVYFATEPFLKAKFIYSDGSIRAGRFGYKFTGADSHEYFYINAPVSGLSSIEFFKD